MRKGGQNKTHACISNYAYMDSFDISNNLHGFMYVRNYLFKYVPIEIEDENTTMMRFWTEKPQYSCKIRLYKHVCISDQLYFICPDCGKRQRFLYLRWNKFACRKCQMLNYEVQQRTRECIYYYDLAVAFARERLNYTITEMPINLPYVRIPRPKYMQRKVYVRLIKKYNRYVELYKQTALQELSKILHRSDLTEKDMW